MKEVKDLQNAKYIREDYPPEDCDDCCCTVEYTFDLDGETHSICHDYMNDYNDVEDEYDITRTNKDGSETIERYKLVKYDVSSYKVNPKTNRIEILTDMDSYKVTSKNYINELLLLLETELKIKCPREARKILAETDSLELAVSKLLQAYSAALEKEDLLYGDC